MSRAEEIAPRGGRSHRGFRAAFAAIALAWLSSAAAISAHAEPPPVTETVSKMQKLYDRTKDLKGKFKQVHTDELYNRKRTYYGYLYVKKPGMMRWNYVAPEKKQFISDGKVLWVWEPRSRQVFKNPLNTKTLSTGLAFLLGTGELTDSFDVSYATARSDQLGDPGRHLVLKLSPKKPKAGYRYLLIAVRRRDYVVEESMIVRKHATNHFIFSKLVFDSGLSRSRFRFRPPSNTRVIDTNKLQRRTP